MKNELKILIKNCIITSIVIGIYGAITFDPVIFFALFGGSLVSILTLLLLIKDAQIAVISADARRITVVGYAKRYFIYGIFMFIIVKTLGFSGVVLGGLGLLNVKFNILLFAFKKIIKKLKKRLKN